VSTKIKNIRMPSLTVFKKVSSHINRERKKEIKFLFFLSILSALAELISIALLIPFVGFFVNPDNYLFNNLFNTFFNFLNITSEKDILRTVTLSFALIVLISGFIKLKYIRLTNLLTDNITSDFRIKIFKFLINQDLVYFLKYGSNEILSNIVLKTSSFNTVIFGFINIFTSILISVAVLSVIVINEPFYTPIIIGSIVIFFLIIYKIKSVTTFKKGQLMHESQNYMIHVFQNTVGYLPEIITYNIRNFFLNNMNKLSRIIAESTADIRTIAMSPKVYLETFIIFSFIFFIYFLDLSNRTIESNIAYLAILIFGTHKSLPLINQVYTLSINLKGAIPIIQRYLEILDDNNVDEIIDKNFGVIKFNKAIKLENISFQYSKNLPSILNNFSFTIKKGEKIAIKGKSGTGKSTLINIITGLLNPTSGNFFSDETQINSENLKSWRKNVSIVPQTVFINDATVQENIAIALDINSIDFEKVKKCAQLAQIDTFIESLPNKYNQTLGERGVRLSGGQKQRMGIARALYRNAQIIVLDEPTNALDNETENLVMNSITMLSKDTTLIMISHSDTSLKYFDKIIDLDKLN